MAMKKIIVLDPGDSTGWITADTEGRVLDGGTIYRDLTGLDLLIREELEVRTADSKGDLSDGGIIVYETFHLYPGAAKHLTHNEFYPCQVIGVIKRAAMAYGAEYLVGLSPSVKKYSGGLDDRWSMLRERLNKQTTEHTKDAYLLLNYFERFYRDNPAKLSKQKTPEKL